ncbi:MAG: hypothetical protein AAGA56_15900 [Myxococcota bacterium]
MAPGATSLVLEAGRHTLTLQAWSTDPTAIEIDEEARIDVIAVQGSLRTAGTIDLNLRFTGAGGLEASTAPSDARLQNALQQVREVYDQAGVSLGDVRYLDMDAALRDISFDFTDPSAMLALNAFVHPEDNPRGINVVFTGELDGSQGKAMFPGPVRHGTWQTGAVIALAELEDDDTSLGLVLGHELGHTLGLWHTQDRLGADVVSDRLDDTIDWEANLMNSEVQQFLFTPEQANIIRMSPWVY